MLGSLFRQASRPNNQAEQCGAPQDANRAQNGQQFGSPVDYDRQPSQHDRRRYHEYPKLDWCKARGFHRRPTAIDQTKDAMAGEPDEIYVRVERLILEVMRCSHDQP